MILVLTIHNSHVSLLVGLLNGILFPQRIYVYLPNSQDVTQGEFLSGRFEYDAKGTWSS